MAPSSNFKQTTLAPRGVLLNRRASAACRASRSTRAMAKNKKKFYGVKVGRVAGVYEAWDEAEAQVKGYDGALHKSFATRAAAEKYVASPPAPGFVTRRRSSDGGQPAPMFAYPAEVMDAAEHAGGAADDADLPVPAPMVPTSGAVNDREDDAPATAPRWFDPSASTRPTSTEARATWGEFGGRLVMSGPDADNLRPMIDFYERPTGFDEGVTTNVLREAPARRANTSRRASGAAHDLHYDHEDGSGWEMAPGKRTRDAFGVGVPAGTILRAQPEPARVAGFPMGGVTVHFPRGLTPHVPQKITMSKVIAALRQKQNALIESPTGTGKSLSLLCSALAWQEAERSRVAAENEKIVARNAAIRAAKHRARQLRRDGPAAAHGTREATVTTVTTTHDVTEDGVVVPRPFSVEAAGTTTSTVTTVTTSKYFDAKEGDGDGDGDGGVDGEAVAPGVSVHVVKDEKPDLLEEFRFRGGGGGRGGVKVEAGPGAADADVPIPSPDDEEQGLLSVPRIYLCSRTHSQLHQLVKELKRTPYRPKYTILGSRAQYCPIKKSDDECADLTKNKASRPLETACGYYNKKGKLLTELRHAGIWDMEDMAEAADAHRSCKFFAMKDLLADAELVLCPYNYIFDPGIRNALGIELGNAAVIIDEGHNVEDVCREGASFEASLKDLKDGVNELESVVNFYGEAQSALQFMSLMHGWLNRQLDQAKNDRCSTWRRRRVREQNVRPRGPRARRAAVEGRGRRAGPAPRALPHARRHRRQRRVRAATRADCRRQRHRRRRLLQPAATEDQRHRQEFWRIFPREVLRHRESRAVAADEPAGLRAVRGAGPGQPGDDGFVLGRSQVRRGVGFEQSGPRRGGGDVVPPSFGGFRTRVGRGDVRHRHQRHPLPHSKPGGRTRR